MTDPITESNTGARILVDNPRTWEKFDPQGTPKRHRGSTFVSHLVVDSPLYRVGEAIIGDVRKEGLSADFGLLPVSSLHMTVLEGLKDPSYIGQGGRWPDWLAAVEDFPTAVAQMRQRLAAAGITGISGVTMQPFAVYPLADSLTIGLRPAEDTDRDVLDRFRRQAGEALEIEIAPLSEYRFHTSLGYRLTAVEPGTEEKLKQLQEKYGSWLGQVVQADLEPVSFSIFGDMLSFPPLLYFR